MRLIDADALIEILATMQGRCDTKAALVHNSKIWQQVKDLPTIDAVPVRHGKWLDPETFNRPWFRHHIFECSVCRNTLDMDGVNAGRGDANYCPNCGSKMDGEHETD